MTRTDMTPIDLLKEFNHLAPSDIDDMFESLYSNDMLNEKGREFVSDFWKMFIQEDNL